MATTGFDFEEHLQRQRDWSERTFGPGERAAGVVDHIRKELREIEAAPGDLEEWVDVVILALDGAWRSGASPRAIIAALAAKQAKNEARRWPDWRTAEPGKAIEHERAAPAQPAPEPPPPQGACDCIAYEMECIESDTCACGHSPEEHNGNECTGPAHRKGE